ncbi:unnamed protein product, partial [marine sediment metagenome]
HYFYINVTTHLLDFYVAYQCVDNFLAPPELLMFYL